MSILPLDRYTFNGSRYILRPKRNWLTWVIGSIILVCWSAIPSPITPAFVEKAQAAVPLSSARVDSLVTGATSYIQSVNKSLTAEDAQRFAQYAIDAATEFKLKPSVYLALVKAESYFDPDSTSRAGAKGLAQVIPKHHLEKIEVARKKTGAYSIYEPRLNLFVGAWALRDYIAETRSLEEGLLRYNGSALDPRKGYARLVMAEAYRVETNFLRRKAE